MTFCVRQNTGITIIVVVVTATYKCNEQESIQGQINVMNDKI